MTEINQIMNNIKESFENMHKNPRQLKKRSI